MTKKEIFARIDELKMICEIAVGDLKESLQRRINTLESEIDSAQEDIADAVIRSHKAVCKAKQMDEKAAYGQDAAFYYSAAATAECGEMLNKVVRGLRNGNNTNITKAAVISELPDVITYSFLLAYLLDLDLPRLVTEKVEIIIKRAEDGYYGGPLR